MRHYQKILAIIGLLFLGAELGLRFGFGLASPALIIADKETGYRFKENQKIFRFGRHIKYNQYSQRSEVISVDKSSDVWRLLMVGDSVLNGGNPTDQADIITEKLENKISEVKSTTVEVLNASAGSWGIGNQAGYLEKFGLFDSDLVILQIGSHDLEQPTSTSDAVGRATHPDKKPILATQELLFRYLLPRATKFLRSNEPTEKLADEIPETNDQKFQFEQNMEALSEIQQLIEGQKTPVFILFTPSRKDLLPEYVEPEHKADFLAISENLEVPVIDVHQAWAGLPDETIASYFRDKVHLSVDGNQAVADLVFNSLCTAASLDNCSSLDY